MTKKKQHSGRADGSARNVDDSANRAAGGRDELPRRRTLKAVLAGGAVVSAPAAWQKPVVDSVLMPTHAQSSPTEGPCGSGGPCTNNMTANILFAELVGGDLIVVGDAQIPPNEGCGFGDPAEPPTWTEPQLVCEVISDGNLIADETFQTANDPCGFGTAAVTEGCMVSCSVSVGEASHDLAEGDCVTLRFNFAGGCVCSDVTTVA
jgi:hypothetical protein